MVLDPKTHPSLRPGVVVLFHDELPTAQRDAALTAIALTAGVKEVHNAPRGASAYIEALGAARASASWRQALTGLLEDPRMKEEWSGNSDQALREALEDLLNDPDMP